MTDISQTGPVSGGRIPLWTTATRQEGRAAQPVTHQPNSPDARTDSVELSSLARELDAAENPGIRTDLVNHVRSLIARGEYLTSDRIDATVDALIDQYG